MLAYEKEITVPRNKNTGDLLGYLSGQVASHLNAGEVPIRFVITATTEDDYICEIAVIAGLEHSKIPPKDPIFSFKKRPRENTESFNAVLLIPTGIGAEIGGQCGDGNPVAHLLSPLADTLITHPNVVNAADICELPDNGLYVEGSIITRFMMGQIGLQKVRSNKILLLMDKHKERMFNDKVVNCASSVRVTLGMECDVHEMEDIIQSVSLYTASGRATGKIEHLERLFSTIEKYKDGYDALALSTFIKVPPQYHKAYFAKNSDMVNPWGGIEAMLTHGIAETFNIPCAHAPMMTSSDVMGLDHGVVDPRKAPEMISITYLISVLKGMYRSPKVVDNPSFHYYPGQLTASDVSCLIIPDGCVGLPTLAALQNGIPIIAVRNNKNCMKNDLERFYSGTGKIFFVEDYLEAAGVMAALKAGISLESVSRPIANTKILR